MRAVHMIGVADAEIERILRLLLLPDLVFIVDEDSEVIEAPLPLPHFTVTRGQGDAPEHCEDAGEASFGPLCLL